MTPLIPFPLDASLDELITLAPKKFEVRFKPVNIGEQTLEIAHITNITDYVDKLVREAGNTKGIQLPLWAKIWPASTMLAYVAGQLPCTGNESLLEIGSGLGIPGLVAAKHGFKTIISDINDDALLFARMNALKNDLGNKTTVRKIDISLSPTKQKFDIILGSEMLYLQEISKQLVEFLRASLSPTGMVLLAHNSNRQESSFLSLAAKIFQIRTKTVTYKECVPMKREEKKMRITLYQLVAKPRT